MVVGGKAATYDFVTSNSGTNGWQPYTPLASDGVGASFSDGYLGYRFQSAPSVNPGEFGNARLGSFLPGSLGDFSLSFDVAPSNSWPQEFFGAATRVQNLGPGTTSGYVFGYDKSVGDIYIAKVVNDTLQGPLSASAPVTLRFVTDTSFASGEAGLVVFSQSANGPADATFRDFTETPEPATAAFVVLGAWAWTRVGRQFGRGAPGYAPNGLRRQACR
jgi:hypothetical protein